MGGRKCPMLILIRLASQIITFVISGSAAKPITSIKFTPPFVHDLIVGKNVTVEMTMDIDTKRENYSRMIPKEPWEISLRSIDNNIAMALGQKKRVNLDDFSNGSDGIRRYTQNFTIFGMFIGKTAMKLRIVNSENIDSDDLSFFEIPKEEINDEMLSVWVSEDSKRLVNRVFISTLIILIVIANVLMGFELDLSMILQTLKEPVAPLIGFFTQYLTMPLLAFAIANVFFVSQGLHSLALGLFITGCAPGGGASNYWTILLGGNLAVSLTMTFISTLASLIMMPMWIWLLGSHFLKGSYHSANLDVPYTKIISSLLVMVIPLIVGILWSKWKPHLRPKAQKFAKPFMVFILVFLIVFGTIANLYMIKLLTLRSVFGGLLLPWCGFAIGCFLSIILRQSPENVTTIAIETGIQNTGIAIMLLKISFPDPDADISSLIPVIAATATPIPLLFIVGIHSLWRYYKIRNAECKEKAENTGNLSSICDTYASGMERNELNSLVMLEKRKKPC